MRRLIALIGVALAAELAFGAGSAVKRIEDFVKLTRDESSSGAMVDLEAVVISPIYWQEKSVIVASPNDPNGSAVYVAGDFTDGHSAEIAGGASLGEGDVVRIMGRTQKLLLEPGIAADRFEVVRHMELPPPSEVRLADLQQGRMNNRRIRIRGVLRSVEREKTLTLLSIGTRDGTIVARLRGEFPQGSSLVDAEVAVEGLSVSLYNARAECLFPEMEISNPDAITVLSSPCDAFDAPLATSGVFAWEPGGSDGHRRRICGTVIYAQQGDGFIVDSGEVAIKVTPRADSMPSVGDSAEVSGFPVMKDGSGELENAVWRKIPGNGAAGVIVPAVDHIERLIIRDDLSYDDYQNRLVRLSGRVVASEMEADNRARIVLAVGSRRVSVICRGADARRLVELAEDSPIIEATGICRIKFERDPVTLRHPAFGEVSLVLSSPDDARIVPDRDWRTRHWLKRAWWLLVVVLLSLLVILVKMWRERIGARAVQAERRRLAGVLHDSISQHLAGTRILIYSALSDRERLPPETVESLVLAGTVLEQARLAMRDSIQNLQSDDLVSKSLGDLVGSIADEINKKGIVRVRKRLAGVPARLSLAEKTDLLAIVQEAVGNAIRHGKAKNVLILSDLHEGAWRLRILNDGEPFDDKIVLGAEAGHFGLTNMRERAKRLRADISFGTFDSYSGVALERRAK